LSLNKLPIPANAVRCNVDMCKIVFRISLSANIYAAYGLLTIFVFNRHILKCHFLKRVQVLTYNSTRIFLPVMIQNVSEL